MSIKKYIKSPQYILYALAVIAVIVLLVLYITDRINNPQRRYDKYTESYFEYFDTVSTLTGFDESEEAFLEKNEMVKQELDKYNQLFDIYHSYEGVNNIATINSEGTEKPVKVNPEIITFLQFCKDMYEETNGITNVALGSVLVQWHEARETSNDDPARAYLPDMADLKAASKHCNIDDIVLNEEDSTVFLNDPEMRLDVGAIAKGYACEMIAQKLEEMGADYYSLNLGGNIRTLGVKPNGEPWIVGIQNPDINSEKTTIEDVNIDGMSLVTSGSYQRYFYVDGKKYHHIINPDTLMTENLWESVSIIAKDSGEADALSSALFNMDYQAGLKFINKLDGREAMWVDGNGEKYYSDGFRKYIR